MWFFHIIKIITMPPLLSQSLMKVIINLKLYILESFHNETNFGMQVNLCVLVLTTIHN